MVHRIQKQKLGYSDFSNTQNNVQLNSMRDLIQYQTLVELMTKLDPIELKNTETEMFNSMLDENMVLNTQSLDKIASEISNDTNVYEDVPEFRRTV